MGVVASGPGEQGVAAPAASPALRCPPPRPSLRLLRTRGLEALTVLRLDEALLRASGEGWLCVHDGVAAPAIVLGISG